MFRKLFSLDYSTNRRKLLDKFLKESKDYIRERVLDIGGKKEKKRGEFRPPVERVGNWKYLNIDNSTNPDYCCSTENIPLDEKGGSRKLKSFTTGFFIVGEKLS